MWLVFAFKKIYKAKQNYEKLFNVNEIKTKAGECSDITFFPVLSRSGLLHLGITLSTIADKLNSRPQKNSTQFDIKLWHKWFTICFNHYLNRLYSLNYSSSNGYHWSSNWQQRLCDEQVGQTAILTSPALHLLRVSRQVQLSVLYPNAEKKIRGKHAYSIIKWLS